MEGCRDLCMHTARATEILHSPILFLVSRKRRTLAWSVCRARHARVAIDIGSMPGEEADEAEDVARAAPPKLPVYLKMVRDEAIATLDAVLESHLDHPTVVGSVAVLFQMCGDMVADSKRKAEEAKREAERQVKREAEAEKAAIVAAAKAEDLAKKKAERDAVAAAKKIDADARAAKKAEEEELRQQKQSAEREAKAIRKAEEMANAAASKAERDAAAAAAKALEDERRASMKAADEQSRAATAAERAAAAALAAEAKVAEEQRKADVKAEARRQAAEAKAAGEHSKAEAKAAEEQRKAEAKAVEEQRKAEAKAAEEQRKAEAKAADEQRKAEAKAAAETEAEREKSRAGTMSAARLARSSSRMLKASPRAAAAEDDGPVATSTTKHSYFAVETPEQLRAKKAADAKASKKDDKGKEAFGLQQVSYDFPSPAAWWANWRDGGSRGAEMDADAGFVSDCLAIADEETIAATDGLAVSVYKTSGDAAASRKLYAHADKCTAIACDGEVLASGSRDKCIRLWSWRSGECTAVLEGCEEMICGLTLRGDVLLSGEGKGADAKARLWSITAVSGQITATLPGHGGPIWSVAIGEKVAVTASQDATARVWPLEGATDGGSVLTHPNWVFAVCVEGDVVATGCRDGCVRLWSLATLTCIRSFEHVPATKATQGFTPTAVYSVKLTSGVVISGGEDTNVRFWSLGDGACIGKLAHGASVKDVVVSRDGQFVASVGGKKLIVWRPLR